MTGEEPRGLPNAWPDPDAPGKYRVRCSCRAAFTGTARQVRAWSRSHDDSPGRRHVVSIDCGGARVDQPPGP